MRAAHAPRHCKTTTKAAFNPLPISRFTALIAAAQGVYNKVNTKNPHNRHAGKQYSLNTALRFDVAVPVRTLNVLTTASFAVNPVMSAVETLQSENPSGAKTGAIHLPTNASRLLLLPASQRSIWCQRSVRTR